MSNSEYARAGLEDRDHDIHVEDDRYPEKMFACGITSEDIDEIERIERGELPHEVIATVSDERDAVPCCKDKPYIDPELSDEDIITDHDESKDLRYKATQRILTDKEVRFIVHYYKNKDSIRNIVIDFEDALSENMLKLGQELLSEGFVWAAEEARAYLRNLRIDLPMCDLDMIHAAFRYAEKGQPHQVRAIIDRFSESRNLDGSRVLEEKTIDDLETLLNLCSNQAITILVLKEKQTTPPST